MCLRERLEERTEAFSFFLRKREPNLLGMLSWEREGDWERRCGSAEFWWMRLPLLERMWSAY